MLPKPHTIPSLFPGGPVHFQRLTRDETDFWLIRRAEEVLSKTGVWMPVPLALEQISPDSMFHDQTEAASKLAEVISGTPT